MVIDAAITSNEDPNEDDGPQLASIDEFALKFLERIDGGKTGPHELSNGPTYTQIEAHLDILWVNACCEQFWASKPHQFKPICCQQAGHPNYTSVPTWMLHWTPDG